MKTLEKAAFALHAVCVRLLPAPSLTLQICVSNLLPPVCSRKQTQNAGGGAAASDAAAGGGDDGPRRLKRLKRSSDATAAAADQQVSEVLLSVGGVKVCRLVWLQSLVATEAMLHCRATSSSWLL